MYAAHVLALQPQPESEEATLISAAQGGNRAAFGRLYERYVRMIHGIVLSSVPYADAEDVVQDVFVTAMKRIGSLREAGALGGWLATIARNAAHDLHRRRREIGELDGREATRDRVNVEAIAVLEEIQRLPEAYRETLIMRLVEQMTGPEIAERTGMTPASVRVNLCRGMKMLRERLAP